MNGANPGSGYSQLDVSGAVDLGGSNLTGTVGFAPASGESFTIIHSSAPIAGEFFGLAEGATVRLGNYLFTITYAGGGGHDVVLNESAVVTPVVSSVTPSSGTQLGGTSVIIDGSGFTGFTDVDFGSSPATNISFVDDTRIIANSPSGSGVVDVRVTTPTGISPASPTDKFTYTASAAPVITSIFPNTGPSYGTTTVEIDGTGFTGATEVDFGPNAVTGSGLLVSSDTAILVSSPPGTGVVDIRVKTPGGTSAITPVDQFTYTLVAGPEVTSITPSSGPTAGGTLVTITGTGFIPGLDVHFGSTPASYTLVDDKTIAAASPPGSGTVDITVTTAAGTSPVTTADQFTYVAAAAPAVSSITPNHGPQAGGTSVTITGTGFTGATDIAFGTNAAATFNVVNDTTITVASPPGQGIIDVTVTTPSGTSPSSQADIFTYDVPSVPSVEGVTPNSGPAFGGTTVTINGNGLVDATLVHFGPVAASGLVVINDSTITVISPPAREPSM